MNQKKELMMQMADMLHTLIEASEIICDYYSEACFSDFYETIDTMLCLLNQMDAMGIVDIIIEPAINFKDMNDSVIHSLLNVKQLSLTRSAQTLMKIEFELLPLCEFYYTEFYFYTCIYPEQDLINEFIASNALDIMSNRYANDSIKTGKYKYELSIVVLAFNHLDYNKLCIEHLIKNIPSSLNYELILLNHGSRDGTKKFFEAVNPTKQVDTLNNGTIFAHCFKITEGKYTLHISNDVIITPKAIENMLTCMESDEKIARIVPSTANIANYQGISANYQSLKELDAFAIKNNISNPYRWEIRSRLCDPISLIRTSLIYSAYGLKHYEYKYKSGYASFPDDQMSLLIRRNGYKNILAKDAYCHHFGGITLTDEVRAKDEQRSKKKEDDYYTEGRKKFFHAYGIDPWGIGFCWDKELIEHLRWEGEGPVNVLGINCGMGSNPLKIKESIRETFYNDEVKLYNASNNQSFAEDLIGISDYYKSFDTYREVANLFEGVCFKYIVIEEGIATILRKPDVLKSLIAITEKGGVICVRLSGLSIPENLGRKIRLNKITDMWGVIERVPMC